MLSYTNKIFYIYGHYLIFYFHVQRLILLIHGEVPPIENMDKDLKAYIKLDTYIHSEDKDFWKKIR